MYPKEWSDKYKGKVRQGLGQDSPRRQPNTKAKMGVIPADSTKLAEEAGRHQGLGFTLPADERRLFARQAEVFAGFMEQTDHEVGRLVDAIDDIGELDNTVIFYIAGRQWHQRRGWVRRNVQ